MILVDTSVWVDHLRRGSKELAHLLDLGQVLAHPYVIGELALGSLKERGTVLHALRNLPVAIVATDLEVLGFIDRHTLYGIGIGYVDSHLLAAALLTPSARLWTLDKRLHAVANKLHLAHALIH